MHQQLVNINIYWLCALTFLLAALSCSIVTPLIRRMAFALGAFDEPDDDRRVHAQPTPRLGGLAIFVGFMLALFAMLNVALTNNYVIHHYLGTRDLAHIIGLLSGGTLMLGVGLWDDIMGMKPGRKFLAQFVVAAITIILYKFTVFGFTLPHVGYIALGWLAIPFSLFWYLGMVNAINFMDGLDGLVTGVTIIASITMIVVSWWHHEYLVAITMCALGGAAAGFLPFNYNPARIFMGDGGSLFIGFVMASAAVMGTEKVAVGISLLVPLLVLALPILDTARVIIARIGKRVPIFDADRSHAHHQLLDFGLTQRQVVNIMYVVCGILGAIAIVLSRPGGPHVF